MKALEHWRPTAIDRYVHLADNTFNSTTAVNTFKHPTAIRLPTQHALTLTALDFFGELSILPFARRKEALKYLHKI